MVLSREGKGRVRSSSPISLALGARFRNGGPHLDLLRGRALADEGAALEEEALRGAARGRTITIERQTMSDAAAPVTLSTPGGSQKIVELKEVQPGRFEAVVDTDEIGLHRIADDKLTAFVGVGPGNPPRMARDPVINGTVASDR